MVLKFNGYLPEDLKKKYFDFTPRTYSDDKFCNDLLNQIEQSYHNYKFYREKLCKKFKYNIPDELNLDDLHLIPYLNKNIFKKTDHQILNLLKVPIDKIVLFSCSSSTSGDPSIVPRTLEDFDQMQYNSIKVFTEFFGWKELKKEL